MYVVRVRCVQYYDVLVFVKISRKTTVKLEEMVHKFRNTYTGVYIIIVYSRRS